MAGGIGLLKKVLCSNVPISRTNTEKLIGFAVFTNVELQVI